MLQGDVADSIASIPIQIFATATAVCCLQELGDISTKASFQVNWVYSEIYVTSVTLTKISILLLYERLFRRSWSTRSGMILCGLFWISSTVVFLTECRPISWFWDRIVDSDGTGYCIDTEKFYFWTGVCDVLLDALVLCIPVQHGN